MAARSTRKPYAKPVLRKHRRLTEVAEGDNIVITGVTVKGGCFSKNR